MKIENRKVRKRGMKMRRVYQRKISSTFLSLIKLLEGILAAGFLVGFVYEVVTFLADVIQTKNGLAELVEDLLTGLAEIIPLDLDIQSWIGQLHLPGRNLLFPLLLFCIVVMVKLLFTIMDGIASVRLRFSPSGAGTIKGIHLLYAILMAGAEALWVAGGVKIYQAREIIEFMAEIDKETTLKYVIITIAIFAAGVVLFALLFCYNIDIVRSMAYVARELNNEPVHLKKMHLSGLSMILGTLMAFLSAAVLLEMLTEKMSRSDWYIIISILLWMVIRTLKFFLVAASNRDLKRYAR